MTQVVSALYDDFMTARRAAEALYDAGFPRDQISVVANDAASINAARLHASQRTDAYDAEDVSGGEGALFGAVSGALIGLIPGIGPVIAGGPLIAALVGGGVGAVAGGITGGLTALLVDFGVDETTAEQYAEGIRRGGTLVVAHTSDEWQQRAVDILRSYGPVDLNTRARDWRERGWEGFEEGADPYSPDDVELERRRWE